ncbi:hypothetical protein [Leisingera sp. JC11]|uniref:hypothetical protein n=1 Tax=Leisingera sp. JC11 TaxID=3042469 RepID=UPI0034567472
MRAGGGLRRLMLAAGLALAAVPAAADPFVACVQKQLAELGYDPGAESDRVTYQHWQAWKKMTGNQGDRLPGRLGRLPGLSQRSAVHWCRELATLRPQLARHMPNDQRPVIHAQQGMARTALMVNYRKVRNFFHNSLKMPMASRPGIAAGEDRSSLALQTRYMLEDLGLPPIDFSAVIDEVCSIEGGYAGRAFPGLFILCWEKVEKYDAEWLEASYRWLGPVLAHEYMHLWQAEVSGEFGMLKPNQANWSLAHPLWLVEGAAEMVQEEYAFEVLDEPRASLGELRREAKGSSRSLQEMRLSEVAFDADNYPLAHFAVRLLAEEHSRAAVFEYWHKLGQGMGWRQAFASSFAMPVEAFEEVVERRLQAPLGNGRGKEAGKGKNQ